MFLCFISCVLLQGIMYGNWETGPWFGFKLPGDDSYAWIGGGTKIFDFMVWRHTCFSINKKSGRVKLVENGVKYVDKISPEIVGWLEQMTDKVRRRRARPVMT